MTSSVRAALPVRALLDRVTSLLVSDTSLLRDMVDHYGSPVSVVLPDRFQENVSDFRAVIAAAGVDGEVFYPQKVSQSSALLEMASTAAIGCECSSLEELRAAMSVGIPGHMTLASGPAKSDAFMYAAARARSTIVLDSEQEVSRLITLLQEHELPTATILLRLTEFMVTTQGRNEVVDEERLDISRFGMTPTAIEQRVLDILESELGRRHLKLDGFHFHLDNHSIPDRVRAMQKACSLIDSVRQQGFEVACLDIGGGFTAQYVQQTDFAEFVADYKARLNSGEPMMFRSKDFGLDGSVGNVGRGNFYPHDLPIGGPRALESLLSSQGHQEFRMAESLRQRNLRLLVEPGKSLVSHVGLVVLEVAGNKTAADGSLLIQCEGNITNFWEQWIGSELTVDPIFVPLSTSSRGQTAVGYLSGNLCLESDMLSWRPLGFSQLPRRGDLLVFPNTAGYQNTFVDVITHRRHPPTRLVVYESRSGLEWIPEERFSPVLLRRT